MKGWDGVLIGEGEVGSWCEVVIENGFLRDLSHVVAEPLTAFQNEHRSFDYTRRHSPSSSTST
jgi:hypothetical protein